MGLIVFRVCLKIPFFNMSWVVDLGMSTLKAKVTHILAVMEWHSRHLRVKFNDRTLTVTATTW
jgi:hypothetical protein